MNKKHTLDLKDVDCPLSFIKTRKFLEQQPSDTKKYLLINSKKTLKELSTTLEDLSQKYSISRERVRQIENKAIKKLQDEIKIISDQKLLTKS